MTQNFTGLKARRINIGPDNRPIIALVAGKKPLAYIEFSAARRLVDEVHDLADQRDRELREGNA